MEPSANRRMALFILKIIYIHTTDISANSTSLTFVVNNAISLAKNGADVVLLIRNKSYEDPSQILQNRFSLNSLPSTLSIKQFGGRLSTNWFFYIGVVWWLRARERSVVITRSHGVLKAVLKWNSGRHFLYFETHDYFLDLSKRTDIRTGRFRKKSATEKKYFAHLNGLLCLNNSQKSLYQEAYPTLDIQVFRTGLRDIVTSDARKKQITYVGSLNKRLGTEILVRLAASLPQDIALVIVGGKSPEEIDGFLNKFDNSELPDNVSLYSWMDKHQLFKILRKSMLGILPLKKTFFNEYLTVPLKLFDYMSCGLPVIASNFPSVREIIEQDKEGILVDWEDPKKVANDIISILKDESRWHNMSENVYRKAKAMTWDQRAKNQIQYLQGKHG